MSGRVRANQRDLRGFGVGIPRENMGVIAAYKDFWQTWYGPEFSDVFERVLAGVEVKKPVVVYSVFGDTPRMADTINVCFSGEDRDRTRDAGFDLHLIMQPTDVERGVVCFPFFSYYPSTHNCWNALKVPRPFPPIPKQGFCLFTVSNIHRMNHVRNVFMQRLSMKYKRVDSCGPALNNTGILAPGAPGAFDPDYLRFIGRYKFMMCFENTARDYYCTEKLFNAYMGGAVPIYWGASKAKEWFNTKAFLMLEGESEEAMDALIARIAELDQDDEKYNAMYREPLLRDGKIPEELDFEKVRAHAREVLVRKGLV